MTNKQPNSKRRRPGLLGRLVRMPCGRRTKFVTLGIWLILAAALTPLALRLTTARDDSTLEALPDRVEAARAEQRARAAFPEPDALVAVAVYARDTGLTDGDRAKVEADRAEFTRYARGGRIAPPTPSEDGTALLFSFSLAGTDDEQSAAADKIKDALRNTAGDGLRTALTGEAGATTDLDEAFAGMDGTLLLVTALAVTVLLLITYRSPILWLIPLLTVGVASQITGGVVYLLVKHAGLTIDMQSQSIMTVLVFGVGVDYALLLIARYREELRRDQDRHAAMTVALRRSLPAICASAATVSIGLLCLLAARLPATHSLGPASAIGVLGALLAMSTLLPAVLVLCGRWVFWPFVPRYSADVVGHDIAEDHGFWSVLARWVGRRPRPIWIASTLMLAALALGIGNLRTGLPGDESFTKEFGFATGQHLIEDHYPGGMSRPVDILATAGTADRVAAAARGVKDVAQVTPPQPAADGRWVRIRAVLAVDPEDAAAMRAVARLRDAVHAVPGAQALVGGDSAALLDTRRAVDRDIRVIFPLILLVVLAVLVILLRSLIAPLLLTASVVVSYAAALGAAGLILHAMDRPKLWDPVPLQTFLFLVALGVDYTIFLMTRAREEVAQLGHRPGVLHAVTVTGGVITSAGVVLAATFASLSVMPLVPSVQMAVIVAVGVLLDTFVVRSLLIPALVIDVGPGTWWPSTLSRSRRRPVAALEPAPTG